MTDDQLDFIESLRQRVKYWMTDKFNVGDMWSETWKFLKYVVDLKEEDLKLIRIHAAFLGGENPIAYWWSTRRHVMQPYNFLIQDLPPEYHIGEPEIPEVSRQIGIRSAEGKLVNSDIARYQSVITILVESGLLSLLNNTAPSVICEIGSSYGGLALHLPQFLKNPTYILVDLPGSLFLAGVYLTLNCPNAKIFIYDGESSLSEIYGNYDYMLIPHFALNDLRSIPITLTVNVQSFQEMSEQEVREYVQFACDNSIWLFSRNRSKHKWNEQLPIRVEDILSEYFYLAPHKELYEENIFATYEYFKSYIGYSKRFKKPPPLNGIMKVNKVNAEIYLKSFT